ncbi:sensor histidine kinase [Mesoterricola sediminis]|uniref:histidine kinase n=1 Tax=Mesoterricola sediminis TaxID=2927980 RepID=A0AA48KDE1_9BACT|nr:sensor histidine kinase [Mesoterricola sediminis]BDU78199.1 hypothetical protein METESE_31570 [Mesoterricola sediminis]
MRAHPKDPAVPPRPRGGGTLGAYLLRLVALGMAPLMVVGLGLVWKEARRARANRDAQASAIAHRCMELAEGRLNERIGALAMLAASPAADGPATWPLLYQEALSFRAIFGSHVILADLDRRMRFNTRAPFGSPLPLLPPVKGRAAFPTALASRRPAVSDRLLGPVADELLVTIAVPVLRDGAPVAGLLTTFEIRAFQDCVDRVPLPAGWRLSLVDSTGALIAGDPAPDQDVTRFAATSPLAPWTAVTAVPRAQGRAPALSVLLGLGLGLVAASLVGLGAAAWAARRFGRAVAGMGRGDDAAILPYAGFREISSVQGRLASIEHRFEALFEQAAVGMAMVAPDGRWLRVNRKLCELLGYEPGDLARSSYQALTHPEDLTASTEAVARLMAGESRSESLPKRYLRRDGTWFWAQLTTTLARTPEGDPDYFISVVEDITGRRRAEEEIRALNATLEQRVEEKTAELQAANQELEAFAYAVSHDLRAPLRAMNGFSQALLEDFGEGLAPDARGYLEEIMEASRRMGLLIDGLLDVSRSTRGDLAREDVDLSDLARRILGELQAGDPDRAVAWEVEPGLAAHGDPRLLDVVLRNLLGNAWKYTARTAHPFIRVHGSREDGASWICVTDNGAGFDMAHAARLYKPFQRLHRQDEFQGLGIGLATVQRILRRHGGRIEARSEPGRGAAFRFTLPAPEETTP